MVGPLPPIYQDFHSTPMRHTPIMPSFQTHSETPCHPPPNPGSDAQPATLPEPLIQPGLTLHVQHRADSWPAGNVFAAVSLPFICTSKHVLEHITISFRAWPRFADDRDRTPLLDNDIPYLGQVTDVLATQQRV